MGYQLKVDEKVISISNPDKYLWPNSVTKLDFIKYIYEIADYMLPYVKNRLLTTIRYPNGVDDDKSFYQKNVPAHAPEWITSKNWNGTNYILPNDKATLVWLANLAALEMHVSFNYWQSEDYPTELVFDLDPSVTDRFDQVLEIALYLNDNLLQIGLHSIAKTSGATGIQIYIPIKPIYKYEQTRKVAKFIAEYMENKYPKIITTERLVKQRGTKLYIDYLQHWRGKTLPAPYSVRARQQPTVSTPVTWEEVEKGFKPEDFTIFNTIERIEKLGNLFIFKDEHSLDQVLKFIK
ncbi:non-homologous end-joining DNA ligase [Desulfuribacillus alkaliarsenatis]|uniref:DNA polymerase domain-containing protein n=1 Tax=Desulfuribacillus alkaliarsenatis TaxID=766136 RepID=A0A1E5G5Y9_9FIRM|nr:non-homologous end-joining DNA ligase [Desulfuribacillus alkaliarsenatis]OEF98592.1 DNA polymerase domain-containing protein [Desulfuribacillus alkaliarsenatis]